MNYAWEAVLQAEEKEHKRDELRFVEASCPNPYIEVSMTDLNEESPEADRIEINPLYRFTDVFGRLFDKNVEDMVQTRELLFDVCMHYFVQIDLREGLTKENYYYGLIAEDINNGKYGVIIKRRYQLFDKQEKRLFCVFICIS